MRASLYYFTLGEYQHCSLSQSGRVRPFRSEFVCFCLRLIKTLCNSKGSAVLCSSKAWRGVVCQFKENIVNKVNLSIGLFSSLLCAYAIYYNSCTLNKYTLVAEKFMKCLIMHIRSESEKYIFLQPWMYDTIKHCHSHCRRFIDFELTDLSLRSIPQRSDAFFISVRILQQVLWQGNNFSSNKFVSDDDSGSWKTEVWLSVRSGRPKMNHGNGILVKVTTYIDWQAYRILHE